MPYALATMMESEWGKIIARLIYFSACLLIWEQQNRIASPLLVK